ncbi:hypothetical protein AB1Y20_006996 [Prymnesium parvum]|uniref:Uncharacterized protein n=1 Tax=Prymnesium parvum TaxID=97485 RepID=A0AB34J1A6_PRYPA
MLATPAAPLLEAAFAAALMHTSQEEAATHWTSGRPVSRRDALAPPRLPSASRLLLERTIEGGGFHLSLHSNGTLLPPRGEAPPVCTHWAAIEELPPSVLFNAYELKSLYQRGWLRSVADALTTATCELEQPAEASRVALLLIAGELSEGSRMQTSVPFHIRYSSAAEGGATVAVALPSPRVLLYCHATHVAEGAPHWYEVETFSAAAEPRAYVPIGDTALTGLVMSGTLLVTLTATTILFAQALRPLGRWSGGACERVLSSYCARTLHTGME